MRAALLRSLSRTPLEPAAAPHGRGVGGASCSTDVVGDANRHGVQRALIAPNRLVLQIQVAGARPTASGGRSAPRQSVAVSAERTTPLERHYAVKRRRPAAGPA